MTLPGDGLSSCDGWHHDVCAGRLEDAQRIVIRLVPARASVGLFSPALLDYEQICVAGSHDNRAALWL